MLAYGIVIDNHYKNANNIKCHRLINFLFLSIYRAQMKLKPNDLIFIWIFGDIRACLICVENIVTATFNSNFVIIRKKAG